MLRPLLDKLTAAAAGGLLTLLAFSGGTAHAVVIVEASVNGGDFETVATSPDNSAALANVLTDISGSVSATSTLVGPYPVLQLTHLTNDPAVSVVVRMTVTDLSSPAMVERLRTSYSDTLPAGAAEILVESFIDPGNTPFGTTIAVGSGGPVTEPVSTSILTQLTTPVAPLFSLTLINTLTDISGPANFTSTFAVVPEPGSLGLIGAGLVVAGLMLRRRRKTTHA